MLLALGHVYISLLPIHSRKLMITKQWCELAVEPPASQFSWQQLIKYKLILVLSLINRLASEIIVGIHQGSTG